MIWKGTFLKCQKCIFISVCKIWFKKSYITLDYQQYKNRVKYNRTVTGVWKGIFPSSFTSVIHLSILKRRADRTKNFNHNIQLWSLWWRLSSTLFVKVNCCSFSLNHSHIPTWAHSFLIFQRLSCKTSAIII